MPLNSEILRLLSEKSGDDVTTLWGADKLLHAIRTETGETLSANTVKRLVGLLDYDGRPRQTTLTIVARYLGFDSYAELVDFIERSSSGFNVPDSLIDVSLLPENTRIRMEWRPDRHLIVCHEGGGWCRVAEASRSKLQEGDRLRLTHIGRNFPLRVAEVVRQGRSLGNYTAAPEVGLAVCEIID